MRNLQISPTSGQRSAGAYSSDDAGDDAGDVTESDRGRDAEGSRDGRAPFRLGEGASATALFAQRLGANIRRGVRRGVSELKKMERSEQARGLRGFLGGVHLGGAADGEAVPRLND